SRGNSDGSVGWMAASIAKLLGSQSSRKDKLRFVRAGAGTTVKLIPVAEVLWIEAEDKYITGATREGRSITRMALREQPEQLDEDVLWQIRRGPVVNPQHLARA